MNVAWWNALPDDEAQAALTKSCASTRWVEAMARARPFASADALLDAAARAEKELTRDDWLEAFAGHPRIGDVDSLRRKFASTAAWCEGEQAGVRQADDETLQRLAAENREYEAKFGHLFIVCATGKSAAEMLALLRERLANDPEVELAIAAGEQAKITRLRLERS
jgi:2-oxo-4-hydroxy-4-carboxy-5-ureidoimidazoline decarboxylase